MVTLEVSCKLKAYVIHHDRHMVTPSFSEAVEKIYTLELTMAKIGLVVKK